MGGNRVAKAKKSIYFCQNCGHEESKWLGQCPMCREWNTFVEEKVTVSKGTAAKNTVREAEVVTLSSVSTDQEDRMQTEIETFSKEAADDVRSLEEEIAAESRQRYDYREFLRKFCVLKEEMQVDLDSFDYIFYNYGMELYGNMPLIEPLETKEQQKIEDFVIVVDTSMSCKGELIKSFLEQTCAILQESESFFRRLHIHIIQCDDKVQEDVVIRSKKEFDDYMRHFTVRGFGGTDFRPAFAYVQELLARKAFTRLRGLIYFTDGYGTFPVKKPPYETAFVFLKEDYRDVDVPPWAIKLILEEEDLERRQEDEY